MANTTSPVRYLNIADIKKHWLEVIAPNYFDFDIINNYQVGVFGYINEVMGEATEDGFNAVNAARREFYPITAEYMSSLYKMATLQGVEIPVTTPATCKAALVLSQNEVIANSTYNNGIYSCVLDNCLKIFADNLQFMMDYPVVILSKKNVKGGWSHTIHYDVSTTNSLNTSSSSRYIAYKVIKNSGMNYLVLFLDTIRQVEMTRISNIIIKDSILDTTSIEIDFDGNLAGFEVFYIANQTAPRVQLKKVLMNGKIPSGPFCYYERINNNKIRLTFPAVTSFTPEFNSEIETVVYTSSGADGNFDQFDGELICTSDSADYPYNSNMTIVGQVNGSATGGVDQMIDEEFRTEILRAYATNYTVTTSNDLQVYFDRISESITNMRVAFRKKRDDAFVRLWGAYLLMKDKNNNVIPANTLDLEFKKSDICDVKSPENRIAIKPGTKLIYQAPNDSTNFKGIIRLESDTRSYMDKYGECFTFTNPFLMIVNLQPNTIGYYLNSIDEVKTIEYKYVNDDTATQFIANNLKIFRNAMNGSNYYKLTISLSGASDDLDPDVIAVANPYSVEEDEDKNPIDINGIRATQNGIVESCNLVCKPLPGQDESDTTKYVYLETIIRYEDDSTMSIVSSNVLTEQEDQKTGYKMNFNPGESFLKDDILATKLATDLGKLKLVGDINGVLYASNMYIPFQIEEINDDIFTFCAYLSTTDFIDSEANMEIMNGIFNMDSTPNVSVALPIEGIDMELHAFYKNDDINFNHKYSDYPYLKGYTLTNTYISSEDSPIVFIEPLKFIRSTLDFFEVVPTPDVFPISVNAPHECETLEVWSAPRAESDVTYEVTFHGKDVPVEITDPDLRNLFEDYEIPYTSLADFQITNDDYIVDDHVYTIWEWNNVYKDLQIPFKQNSTKFGIKSELIAPGDLDNGNYETEHWLRRTELTGAQLREYKFLMGIENGRMEIVDNDPEESDEENENAVKAVYLLYSYMLFSDGGGEYVAPTYIDKADYGISVTECPLLSYDWAMVDENYTDFIKRLKQIHEKLAIAYLDLENNFSIDMKFYNTYGKSRFYTVGLDDASIPLNNISCTFSFGVRTSTLANKDEFIRKLRTFIKEQIEDIDNIKSGGTTDIYIHNISSAIYEEYKEVGYLIYYGFNIYGTDAQKIVGPDLVTYQRNYIPEFLNVKLTYDPDGNPYPDITINLLEE